MITFRLVLALVLVTFCASFAYSQNSAISFSIDAAVSNNENTGTFNAAGYVVGSGNFYEVYSFNGKKSHSEVCFTFADGTITAKTHSVITINQSTATGTGTWIITQGTGAYAGIKGSGELVLTVTNLNTPSEAISQQWTGVIKQ
jgi:hypothetical protein